MIPGRTRHPKLPARHAIMLVSLLLLSAPLRPAQAQMSTFNNGFNGTLSGDDMNAMMAAGEHLYGGSSVHNGAKTTWSNPNTGNRGNITVLQSFTRQGMQCRKVRYDNRVVNLQGVRSATVNWCKTPSGEWKIA